MSWSISWKNLSIRKKIGSGFAIVIGISVITGIILLINLFRISMKMEELSEIHIPTVHGSNQLMRLWQETSEHARSFDFTGDNHFKNQTNISFPRMETALQGLITLTENRMEELEGKGVFLNQLQAHTMQYKTTRKTYETVAAEFHKRRDHFTNQLVGLNTQFSSSGYGELKFLAQFNGLVFKLNQYIFDREGVRVIEVKPELEKLRNNLRQIGTSGEFSRKATALCTEAIDMIELYKQTRIAELKNYEAAKNVMWEVKASSDIGLDQIMLMGSSSNEVMKQQRTIQIITISLTIILGLLLIWLLSNSIGKPIAEGIEMAEKVAAGDLTVSIKADRQDEVGRLASALNKMTKNLNILISDIIQTSEEIIKSSEELNIKAVDLSEGANQQASSAEEVSSSMEEMHANIQQNTDNSRETEAISTKAAIAMVEKIGRASCRERVYI